MSEIWKPIPDWPWYEASNLGRIKRVHAARGTRVGHIMKAGGSPYPAVMLRNEYGDQKWFKVAVLVLLTFVGPRPPGLECCHQDDDKTNSHLSNLRWGTHKENGQDALNNGVMWIGERNHTAKITEDTVRLLRREYKPGRKTGGKLGRQPGSIRWLAARYGISEGIVRRVVTFKDWTHVV